MQHLYLFAAGQDDSGMDARIYGCEYANVYLFN